MKNTSPMSRSSLRDGVYQSLKRQILLGEIEPGTQLKVETIAHQYAISATPVREALARLEQEHLVDNIPYRGAFVRALSPTDIREIYQLRRILEGGAAEIATPHIPEATLQGVEALFTLVSEEVERGEYRRYFESDVRLHEMIIEYANNRWLVEVISTLNDQVHRIRSFSEAMAGEHIRASLHEHHLILEALKERDPDRARAMVEEHLAQAGERLVQLLLATRSGSST